MKRLYLVKEPFLIRSLFAKYRRKSKSIPKTQTNSKERELINAEDKLPYIEWYDSTNRKDGKLNLTEGELIIRHLMNHSEATLLELLDYLGKENTVVTRRNLKNITLKKLVLNDEILETEEGKYTLAEDDV